MTATVTPTTRDWHRLSACRDADPNLFHAPDSDIPESDQAREARETEALTYCRQCLVVTECATDALALRPSLDHGIAGGMTRDEREKHRRRLATRRLKLTRKAAA